MATSAVSIRMDTAVKKDFEKVCSEIGINLTTAVNIFAKKVIREQRIPFELTAETDPFWSRENLEFLRHADADFKAGKNLVEFNPLDIAK